MSTLINKEKIIAANTIQELQKQIDMHEAKMVRIKNSRLDEKYIKKSLSELEFCITGLREEKLKQMKRYSDINSGLLDEEIIESYRKRTDEINELEMVKNQIKQKNQRDLDQKMARSKKIEKGLNKVDNTYKYSMENEMDKYDRISSSIPPYIKKELQNMPNNHGYIWKGVQFYGAQNDDNCEYMMKEPMKGFCNVYIQDRDEDGYPVGDKYHYKLIKGKLIPVDVNGVPKDNDTTYVRINPGGPVSVQKQCEISGNRLTQREKRMKVIKDMREKIKKNSAKVQPDCEMPELSQSSEDIDDIVDSIKRSSADPLYVSDGTWQNDTSVASTPSGESRHFEFKHL